MTDAIAINQDRLRSTLDEMRERMENALTTDIIHAYMGGVHRNQGVPVADAWNAQFGKYLSAHQEVLGLDQLDSQQPVEVDGRRTSAALWSLRRR